MFNSCDSLSCSHVVFIIIIIIITKMNGHYLPIQYSPSGFLIILCYGLWILLYNVQYSYYKGIRTVIRTFYVKYF